MRDRPALRWLGAGFALILSSMPSPSLGQFSVSQFSPSSPYSISAGSMMIGDFNGDGKSDVVHLDSANRVSVWLSQGNGKFDIKEFSPWPGYQISPVMLIGDFDGDGKSDLLHVMAGAGRADIWSSNGDGTFTVRPFTPWPGYPMSTGRMLIGDFNGDKRSDVFHAVDGADYAYIWTSASGSFEVKAFRPWQGYDMSTGAMLTGDFDGDGKSDVFHAAARSDSANISYSKGDGTFDVRSFSPWPGYPMDTGSWLVGDFNGDGRADLLHVLPGANGVNVWLSNGRGTFRVAPFLPWPGYLIPTGPWLVGDFNNDGYDDVVHVVESEGRAAIWLSNRDRTFRVETFGPDYAILGGQWLTADFRGDGRADLLHGVEGANYAEVWLSKFPGPLTASILVCSLSNTPELSDCGRSNAVQVLDMREPFDNPMMCMMHGQAYLAGTELGRQLAADERVKIVCNRRILARHQ
jgi:FG-GAP-like repeat